MDVTNPFNCAETSLPSQQKAGSQIPPQWYEKQTLTCSFPLLPKQATIKKYIFIYVFIYLFPPRHLKSQSLESGSDNCQFIWTPLPHWHSRAPGSSSITPEFSTHKEKKKKQMLLGGNNFKHSRAIVTFLKMTFSHPLPSKNDLNRIFL